MRDWKMFLLRIFLFISALWLLGAMSRAYGQQAPPDDASGNQARPGGDAAGPARIVLPTGTVISIRIADEVNSSKGHPGDLITGTVDPSVFMTNHVIIPRGTEAHMRLIEDRKGGHLHGKADVTLELVGLVINGEKLDIESGDYRKKQGALSAKAKGAGVAGDAASTSAATSSTPEGGAVGPIIAVFRAAKVDLRAGTRIPFTLKAPFNFEELPETESQR